mgnify:FL=1
MDMLLNPAEVRVLACLVEKQIATPDYYPLTLNSLRTACNQKSNRNPVVAYDDKTVVRAVDDLRDKKLVWMITSAGSRTPKYEHRFTEALDLTPAQVAVLCVLMLRGPQTGGEIRGRSGPLFEFESISAVEETLEELVEHAGGAFVTKLPRQTGRKEHRFAQLLSGEPEIEEDDAIPAIEEARLQVQSENERYDELKATVEELEQQLEALQAEFDTFKQQFE